MLASVGLRLGAGWEGVNPVDCAPPPAWLGITTQGSGRTVGGVLDGGPGEAGGLSPGDEIVALNRYQVGGESDLRQRLAGRARGERVEVTLFRRGRLEQCEVILEAAPATRYEVAASLDAGPGERRLFTEWLGAPYPDDGVVATATVLGTV